MRARFMHGSSQRVEKEREKSVSIYPGLLVSDSFLHAAIRSGRTTPGAGACRTFTFSPQPCPVSVMPTPAISVNTRDLRFHGSGFCTGFSQKFNIKILTVLFWMYEISRPIPGWLAGLKPATDGLQRAISMA